jgi:hypothetical protein
MKTLRSGMLLMALGLDLHLDGRKQRWGMAFLPLESVMLRPNSHLAHRLQKQVGAQARIEANS